MKPTRRAVLASVAAAGAGCLGPPSPAVSVSCPARVRTTGTTRLGFAGDVMLGRGVNDRWIDDPPSGVWGGLAGHLTTLDGLFLNLECCLSDRGNPRPGRTYHFRADPDWAIPALKAVDASWVNLANNHVLDFGPDAFADTLANLSTAGIAAAGAGRTRDDAVQPSILELGDLTVGAFGLTDRSPSYAAGRDRPGTAYARLAPGNPTTEWLVKTALDTIREADPDLVIASLHWGSNWKTEPSRSQRRFGRWLIDHGVDLIHGHSAHVIQGVEVYRGRPIIYDAGDFVDDYAVKPDLHNDRSFLFELVIDDGRLDGLRLRPIVIEKESVHVAGDAVAAWLRRTMRSRSAAFGTQVERAGDGLRIPLPGACE